MGVATSTRRSDSGPWGVTVGEGESGSRSGSLNV